MNTHCKIIFVVYVNHGINFTTKKVQTYGSSSELYQLLTGLFKPYSALWLHFTVHLHYTKKVGEGEALFYGIIVKQSDLEVQNLVHVSCLVHGLHGIWCFVSGMGHWGHWHTG